MKKVLKSIAFLALISLVFSACKEKESGTNAQQVESTLKVKVEQVMAEDVDQLYEYTAIVEANAVNNIAPLTGGRIEKIFVEVGDVVAAGQVVAEMEDNTLKQAKSQLDNLELSFKRIDELYKVGGVSKSEWDNLKTQLDVARTSYKNLKDNTQLVSPISGVVTMRNYDSGDLFSGQPIIQVQQIHPVKLNINVSEKQFVTIKKGMEAKVNLDVYGDEEFAGKVSLVYPTIDARTHTFPVEISLPNGGSKVRPGMYARVTMNYGSEHRVVVPDVAIIKQQGAGDRYVYTYKDGKVSYKKVEIGRRVGNRYELISGVNDGDYVVTTGLSKLRDGMNVELVK